ncbi:hypothetical protein CEXT_395071 [Caerostris extrusa]|uniref:Uncharacterized protein n=1 Tax=Caerostris extrusa TaxID=172846 RepID=A0AAV4YGH9_CAEEX|nr:hypothetical protein CEXT_395071 [Caerostris extrusa]
MELSMKVPPPERVEKQYTEKKIYAWAHRPFGQQAFQAAEVVEILLDTNVKVIADRVINSQKKFDSD